MGGEPRDAKLYPRKAALGGGNGFSRAWGGGGNAYREKRMNAPLQIFYKFLIFLCLDLKAGRRCLVVSLREGVSRAEYNVVICARNYF